MCIGFSIIHMLGNIISKIHNYPQVPLGMTDFSLIPKYTQNNWYCLLIIFYLFTTCTILSYVFDNCNTINKSKNSYLYFFSSIYLSIFSLLFYLLSSLVYLLQCSILSSFDSSLFFLTFGFLFFFFSLGEPSKLIYYWMCSLLWSSLGWSHLALHYNYPIRNKYQFILIRQSGIPLFLGFTRSQGNNH